MSHLPRILLPAIVLATLISTPAFVLGQSVPMSPIRYAPIATRLSPMAFTPLIAGTLRAARKRAVPSRAANRGLVPTISIAWLPRRCLRAS